MTRRITSSQWNSKLRQAQQKQRQVIDKLGREVKAYNQKVKREVDKYNRGINAHNQKVGREVDKYNREMRSHNNRVRANQQRLKNELARFNRQTVSAKLTSFNRSVQAVQYAYEQLEHAASDNCLHEHYNKVLDLSEREAANNVGLMNALLDDSESFDFAPTSTLESPLFPILESISTDFRDRWKGAIYSLNPNNPDAARHFCTSAREIIAGIIEWKAPDILVTSTITECDLTPDGKPTRRAKMRYILKQKGLDQIDLETFIEADISNVVSLFKVFNAGTHGDAGKFNFGQLQAIRKRVEDAIMFLFDLVD